MIRKGRLQQLCKVVQGSVTNMANRNASTLENKPVEEIRIPVPWGHIAGKWWGSKSNEPIIALHGWQDNAGSWDLFARRLPHEYSWLALDMPGHGRSSHFPPGFSASLTNVVSSLRVVQLHLGLSTVHIAGHSLGSNICSYYASLYSDTVESYFGVDAFLSSYSDANRAVGIWSEAIDKLIDIQGTEGKKKYTRDEAKRRYCEAAPSISSFSAEILFERGTEDLGDGNVSFTVDPRFKKIAYQDQNNDVIINVLENITCHVFIIKGRESKIMESRLKRNPKLLEALKSNTKSFKFDELPGDHHLHMDDPRLIVEKYLEFRASIN